MQTQQNNNTCVGAYAYSAGTQHEKLNLLSVTMRRMTCFILQAHTGTGVNHSQHRKNLGEVLEKKKEDTGEWTGRVEISKGEIPGSRLNPFIALGTDWRLLASMPQVPIGDMWAESDSRGTATWGGRVP